MLIGQKIKEIRIEKGISRPDFCGDEQELTVRQLSRIESGASNRVAQVRLYCSPARSSSL